MIHLMCGNQGSGKSLLLTKFAYEAYLKGKTVISNMHFNFPYKQLNYADLINANLQNCVVCIDEIHLLLNARQFNSKINKEITTTFLSQLRKQNTPLYGTTQRVWKVDIRLRDELDMLYQCKKYVYLNNSWRPISHLMSYDKETPVRIVVEVTHMDTRQEATFSFNGNTYFDLYNTYEIIQVDKEGLNGSIT